MCGFAGIVRADGRDPSRELLERMTRRVSHRGPDAEEVVILRSAGVGLGHRRLKVIDLEGGAQPMEDPATGNWTVYNGEIYNFMDLRSTLEARGHRFKTRSDTEVLLKAYGEWGREALTRFNGMFAFAVWDRANRTLLLARDRMGQKPLYYFKTDREFVFASELKALLVHPACPDQVSLRALQRYLVCEFVPAPWCILDGVGKLEPSHSLRLDQTAWTESLRPYWRLPFDGDAQTGGPTDVEEDLRDPEQAARKLAFHLEASVRRRLVSDVPLGVFLSGGIDSSAVAALMARSVPPETVQTFSIGFRDRSFDESQHAARIAGLIGTHHREEILEPSTLLEMLGRIMDVVDEPLGDASIVPTCLLSRFARNHVTVALGGDGGDELFAGYPTFQAERLAGWLYDWQPELLRETARWAAEMLPVSTANISLDFKLKQFFKGADEAGIKRHQIWLGSFGPTELLQVIHPDRVAELRTAEIFDEMRNTAVREGPRNPMDELMAFYARYYLAEDILTKVDRASMSVGLEVRAPFLDPDVVSLACRVPPDLRLRRLTTKYLLKRAMRDTLPPDIVNRPKKGFGIPVARWLKSELRPLMERLLEPARLEREGFLNPLYVDRLKRLHLAGASDNRKQLWTLMVFQLWLERYGQAGRASGS